ncbi:MAG TPA: response regulator [Thermoanaerobaculia bacterium]|jgi:CheY-like chemotaxis protein|nr:response regulator [Thermoanaerobaculia bacterium]
MSKRILLADDSVTIQKVVELTFMDEDFEVRAVSNGDDAVAALDQVQPDLVIADVHMPGANGYEVCRRVKQQRPRTPVLLLVGTFEPFDANEANRAGADSYLKKPFDSQELLQRAHDLIAAGQGPAGSIATTPADEMELWQPQDAGLDETGDVYAAGARGAAEDEPVGPLGHEVPDEMVLEASPWTEAEEGPGASHPSAAPAAQPAPAPQPAPAASSFGATFAAGGTAAAASAAAPPPPASPASGPAATAPASVAANGSLSDADVDRIARRVVELLGDQLVREVAWEVVPDMAELVIKDRLRELERQLEVP